MKETSTNRKHLCNSEFSNAQDNKFRTVLFALLGCPKLGCLIKSAQHSQHQTNTITTTTTTTTIGKNSSFCCYYDIFSRSESITGLKMYAHIVANF